MRIEKKIEGQLQLIQDIRLTRGLEFDETDAGKKLTTMRQVLSWVLEHTFIEPATYLSADIEYQDKNLRSNK